MVRRANKNDIKRIIELLHQVDMVHHVLRPDLFKPNTTKYIGCNNITLNVWDGNDPALNFYRNMGMKVQKTTMEIHL